MRRVIILIALVSFGVDAQSITVSNDSIWLPNNRVHNKPQDSVVVKNNGPTAIWLDSAFIHFDVLDTVHLSRALAESQIEVVWVEYDTGKLAASSYWTMEYMRNNDYRLTKALGGPSARKPLYIETPGDSIVMKHIEIGTCFSCNLEHYLNYFKGMLRLFFSSGQTVDIAIYSTDITASMASGKSALRQRPVAQHQHQSCLANGQKMTKEWERATRKRVRNILYEHRNQ